MKDAKGHGSEAHGAHSVAIDRLGHSPLTSAIPGGYITNDVRDANHGDIYGSIYAIIGNQRVGKIDYSSGDNKIAIQMIETAPGSRNQGIATQMMDRLKAEIPGRVVKWGGTTPDGEAFKRAYYGGGKK